MIQGFSGGLLNRQLIYNLDLPSFQRDFASLKTLNHGTGPAITFTRASNATYFDANGTLQTAANGVPRFDHDPATGASRGLLIEEVRTNLLSGNSQNLTGTGWNSGAATLDSAVVDPAGNTGTVYYVSSGFERFCNFAGTGTQVVLSFFAKQRSGGGSTVRFQVFSSTSGTIVNLGTQDFNFTGTPAGAGWEAFSNVTRTELPNGWFRFSVVVTAASGFTLHSRVDIEADGLSNYVWGIQLEAGAFPTSYIPTTTASATRSADSAVVTPISSFYNQAEGTIFCESATSALVASDNQGIWAAGDNTLVFASGNMLYTTYVSERIAANAFVSGASQVGSLNNTAVAQSANAFARSAFVYKQNDFAISTNGSSVATDTSGNLPPIPTGLSIGSLDRGWDGGGNHLNGWIKKFAYYPKRLSNALLEQLTT